MASSGRSRVVAGLRGYAPPDQGLDPGGALGIAVGERADVDDY